MELRSYNVERLYSSIVKCRIGNDLGVNKEELNAHIGDIKSMLSQIETADGLVPLCLCNRRKDGEVWTPYLQIVEMLILLGRKINCVRFNNELKAETTIKIIL